MTNFEKHLDECMDILAENLAFNTKRQELTTCIHCKCDECLFQGTCKSGGDLFREVREWLDEEYVEPQVDWSKVAVDTPILVVNFSNAKEWEWQKRHFAKYENGKVYAFTNGATSWSANMPVDWEYAKLYKEGVDD